MGQKIEVHQGDRYGILTIIRELPKRVKKRYFLCKCDCGNLREVRFVGMRAGESKSCGCLRNERNRTANLSHGMAGSPLYSSWHCMKQRCLNKKRRHYEDYGGRGIKVCLEWMDFIPFRDWALAHGYKDGLTIERIDCNGNYESSNCTWIPQGEQSNNTRRNRRITYQGKTQILKDWAKELSLDYKMLCNRLRHGWSVEKAFNLSLQTKHSHKKAEVG